MWSRKCGRCRIRCRCERRRFAVEATRFGAAGNDGSVSGRGWAGGQQVRRSVSASGLDATVRSVRALRPVWGPVAMR